MQIAVLAWKANGEKFLSTEDIDLIKFWFTTQFKGSSRVNFDIMQMIGSKSPHFTEGLTGKPSFIHKCAIY